ncbi:unannotated protein [freshwater metagenome]|uniref:Unannotated protein n=1 Tax=freshwater metagenome TaxID=449393 RepID=A0A6J6AE33_9ZZZZ
MRSVSFFGSFLATVGGGVVFIGSCGFAVVVLQTIFAAVACGGANEIKVNRRVTDKPVLVIFFIVEPLIPIQSCLVAYSLRRGPLDLLREPRW